MFRFATSSSPSTRKARGARKVHRAQRSFLQRVALENGEAESFEDVSIAGVGSDHDDLLSTGGKSLQRRLRDLSRAAYHDVAGGIASTATTGTANRAICS